MTDDTSANTAMDTAVDDTARANRGGRIGWLGLAVAIFFGLFYVYDLFAAISNVVGVTSQLNQLNGVRAVVKLAPVPIPWFWMTVDLLASPVTFVFAFVIGRRKSLPLKILLLFVGIAMVAAVSLTAEALA